MKLHNKILLGMGVGAVIGLFLGPKSGVLEHDLYRIAKAKNATLQLDPDDAATKLDLPPNESLDLHILESQNATLEVDGGTQELPARVKVAFDFSKRMALHKKGALKDVLNAGKPESEWVKRPGDRIVAWLIVSHTKIEGGRYIAQHEPISALGQRIVSIVSPVGKLFMRLIKMVIVPLVFASLLVGIAGLGDIRKLGRMGSKTLGLYLLTTAIAVTIGLATAYVIKPGSFVSDEDRHSLAARFDAAAGDKVASAAEAPSAIDNVLNIVPLNPVASMTDNSQMLQIIFFAIMFGIALTLLKEERSKQVVSFMDTIQHAMIVIIHMVMAVAPFGVAALLAEAIGSSGVSVLASLLVYSGAVVLGLLLQAGLVYGGLVRTLAKMRIRDFLRAIRPAQLLGFSTSSSSATLPVSLECAEENLGISEPVASFVLPLGSTVNMDGTALYQGVAAVFIAQVFGIDLSLGAQLGIVFAATAASIGAAGVPGAGMITLAMVLTTAGIPTEGLALILGVDRLLDMFRTSVNVTGDLAVTSVIAVSEGEKLQPLSSADDEKNPRKGFEGRLQGTPHAIVPDDSAEPDSD